MTAPVRRLKFKHTDDVDAPKPVPVVMKPSPVVVRPATVPDRAPEPMGHPDSAFDGVQVFSATTWRQRDQLGEVVSVWMRSRPWLDVVDIVVMQSSDLEFHCLSISVFYKHRRGARDARTEAG